MSQDILSQYYSCLNLPLLEKLQVLTRIIDLSSPNKELQALFPQLISNIFSTSFSNGWGLRTITIDNNPSDFHLLISFLEPYGPIFRLCYKLLSDPQLKYNLPLDHLPQDLQVALERGRCPQFYTDMVNMDMQAANVMALALNPFDYFIFHFALHLVNNSHSKSNWDNKNSVYFSLACDYLTHFLPSDPNMSVEPRLPHFSGKMPMSAPLQTAHRPLGSPSLLLMPDMSGLNSHVPSQSQSWNEVWRSETVLQVFIDIWMNIDSDRANTEMFQTQSLNTVSGPERVRAVRVLVKHIHAYASKQLADPATRSSALRKYAQQILCNRGYQYVKHLVATWPLDASFRMVMELWLSLIQPWRYTGDTIQQDRYPGMNNNMDHESAASQLDASYTQFIAENFPTYTCIFQNVLLRFTQLDLTTNKNAIMLFRLGKVFSQPILLTILRDLETAMTEYGNGLYYEADTTWNESGYEQHNNSYRNVNSTRKWVTVAKQAISELNMSSTFQYEPIFSHAKRQYAIELIQRIATAKQMAERNVAHFEQKIQQENQGIWGAMKNWLMITSENKMLLEECMKVPSYLGAAISQLSQIFGLTEINIDQLDSHTNDSNMEDQSSLATSLQFPFSVTKKLRCNSVYLRYMGDPDLMPIASYESTILIRILYQIASRLNEIYRPQFENVWSRNDFLGLIAREILQPPYTIQHYVKDTSYHQNIVTEHLPARLSLRRLGSYACIFWISLGYVLFRMLSYGGAFYMFVLFVSWFVYVFVKASLRYLRGICN